MGVSHATIRCLSFFEVGLSLADCLYLTDGDLYLPTELARGPWDPNSQHGGAPAALMVDRLNKLQPGGRLTRVTIELMRPVPLTPLTLTTSVEKSGRMVQRTFAELYADGIAVARAGGYLVLAPERGGDGGDAEVRSGVESLDGGGPVLLEEGADDANLGGVIDDVGHEGVEVVAGALVLVGVVEDLLRVELPELAARDGEGEGLDGLLARLAEGGSLGHLALGHELHGDVVFLGELSRDGFGLALLPGLRGELVRRRSLRGVLVGGLQGGLGSARDRVGVGHVAAHGDDDGDHADDNGGGGEEGGGLLLLLPQESCERSAGRAKHLSIPGKVLRVVDEIISGGPSLPGARTPRAWVSGALTVILDFGSTHLWYVTSGRRMRARA